MYLTNINLPINPLILSLFFLLLPQTLVLSHPTDEKIPSPASSPPSTRQPLILGPLNTHSSSSGTNTRPKASISFSLGDPYTKTAAQCSAEWYTDEQGPSYPTNYVTCVNTNPSEEFAFKFPPNGFGAVANFKVDVKHRYTDSAYVSSFILL